VVYIKSKSFFSYVFYQIIFSSLILSNSIIPENNSTLNYVHVLFEWEQEPGAVEYRLNISADNNFNVIILDTTVNSLVFIDKDNIEWSHNYFWRIKPVYIGQESTWSEISSFNTAAKRSAATATIYNDEDINQGLTIFGSFYNYYSAMIDKNGREIWNTGDKNIVYYNSTPYLDLLGCYSNPSLENNLPGIDFSIDSDFIWEEPNEDFLHHDMIKLPNGNYLGIVAVSELGPIPVGSWTSSYQGFGFSANGISLEFPWVGDRLVEWDKDTKEVIWSWSVFDHFSMDDYDAIGGTWLPSSTGYQEYDWTHVNAMIFSEEESVIYISTRHLSRITKISYPSGEVIWNMGRDMLSGDVTIGHDLGFSFQHGLQRLENGNIVTLDNGNLSQDFLNTNVPISRALEISVDNNDAEIVWEYSLPENLFGFASGNAQKLDNGNYLITTVGGNGTSLEVSPDGEIVWEGNYNLCEPICAVYRAHRVPGLYPIAFSVIIDGLRKNTEQVSGIYLPEGNASVSFTINNEGSVSETYNYHFSDNLDWFGDHTGSVDIDSGEKHTLSFNGISSNSITENHCQLEITPEHKPSLSKSVSAPLFIGQLNIDQDSYLVPDKISLLAYPNPFNSTINIKISNVKKIGEVIEIHNVSGKLIETINLNNNVKEQEIKWEAQGLPSGVYFIQLVSDYDKQFKKVLYLK
tara:strand:+ start:2268 stop:4334 length:2067 start_codon:yes stop_codon:yes gene_type:complete